METGAGLARLAWIDVARGVGIIAVVVGHIWTGGPLRDAVYSFHMPLFFLLSGLLAKPQPVGAFVRRQLASQMRPYFAFLILLILIDQIVEPMKGGSPIFHRWPHDLLPILLGGTWLRGPYTIFWFVPCLMVARILFNAALARWPDPLDRRWLSVLGPTLALAYGAGRATDMSPMGLLTVPMAFALLWAGKAWNAVDWRSWMWIMVAPLSLMGLLLVVPTLNMKAADYGWPVLSIACAIATCLLIFRLARRIASCAQPLASIGRASLVLMYLHVAVIHYATPYMAAPARLALALGVPLLVHALLVRVPLLGRLFL